MGQARNQRLDNICEAVAGYREKMNAIRSDEKADLGAALTIMRGKKFHAYRHASVELARVPGEEKLRVRTGGGDATAAVEEEPASDGPGAGEFGEERTEALEDGDGEIA